jgi:chaperonin GroES
MSYQLLEEMDDWEEDTDKLLIQLPAVGCAFRKSYFDPVKGYNCSHLVPAKDFVVNYMTKDLATCPRATHVLTFYPHEIAEKMRSGLWLEQELGAPQDAGNDEQAPHTFLEQHRLWDLDGDDYPEPYIVTVHKETQKVVRVVARFDRKGPDARRQQGGPHHADADLHQVPVHPGPGRLVLRHGLRDAAVPALGDHQLDHQPADGRRHALQHAGRVHRGGRFRSSRATRASSPASSRRPRCPGGALKDNIVPLPTKEPSAVLFSLLGLLIEAAKDVTATQDILSGDAGKGTLPVGTVTALVEQG